MRRLFTLTLAAGLLMSLAAPAGAHDDYKETRHAYTLTSPGQEYHTIVITPNYHDIYHHCPMSLRLQAKNTGTGWVHVTDLFMRAAEYDSVWQYSKWPNNRTLEEGSGWTNLGYLQLHPRTSGGGLELYDVDYAARFASEEFQGFGKVRFRLRVIDKPNDGLCKS